MSQDLDPIFWSYQPLSHLPDFDHAIPSAWTSQWIFPGPLLYLPDSSRKHQFFSPLGSLCNLLLWHRKLCFRAVSTSLCLSRWTQSCSWAGPGADLLQVSFLSTESEQIRQRDGRKTFPPEGGREAEAGTQRNIHESGDASLRKESWVSFQPSVC